jgi:heat shock protein HslJ
MTGPATSTFRRNGRLITGFLIGLASVSLFTACAAGGGSAGGGTPEPAEAVVGTWGSTAPQQPHLAFTDGEVTGTDGCNGITTSYTVDGDTITLDRFMSTQKACTGVDTWLRHVRSVQVDGDVLIVLDASGEQIGTLDRNEG